MLVDQEEVGAHCFLKQKFPRNELCFLSLFGPVSPVSLVFGQV